MWKIELLNFRKFSSSLDEFIQHRKLGKRGFHSNVLISEYEINWCTYAGVKYVTQYLFTLIDKILHTFLNNVTILRIYVLHIMLRYT